MSKPTRSIFPIENGKLTTSLDCNNLLLLNLDTSNLGGLGGSGNDTGTTTAILKGDGNHGFANAIGGTDYATPAEVMAKEDQSTHDSDIATLTANVATNTGDISSLTTSVASKADGAATTTALGLKADDADLQSYITSNDSAVSGLVTDVANVTTALGNKADSSSVSSALAGKEPTLPTTVNDRYILARRNSSGTDAWFFVDPVTLGTTSQTFANGQSFTNTNYDSATASFASDDIGKTIVSAGVIPDNTTILSITSTTRVVLSAATLSTATGETFTIINRLLNNNAGTVTTISVTNNASNLVTAGFTNPTSSPVLTLGIPVTTGANTVYGNLTAFAGTAGFSSMGALRTSLGITTAGQALTQVTNPTAISFPQFTVGNGVITRTPAQVLGDIGGESALTFSTPLTRSVSPPNVIGIQAAGIGTGAGQSGYLTGSDWVAFNGKLAGTRTITTTAPLRIDGAPSANLTTDRTLSMAAAAGNIDGTGQVDGYLKGTDFSTFANKVPQSRTIGIGLGSPLTITNQGQLNANLTLAIPRATGLIDGYLAANDFLSFQNVSPFVQQAGTGGTLDLTALTSPRTTRVQLNQQLTSRLDVLLPSALAYSIGLGYIEFVDIVSGVVGGATATFGLRLIRSGTDLVDNAQQIDVPQGTGYLRVNSNGGSPGRWLTTKYFVDSFKDPLNPTKQVGVDLSFQTPLANRIFSPATIADSVSVVPIGPDPRKWLNSVGSNGGVSSATVSPTELTPRQQVVTGTNTSDTVITDDGSIDIIKISTALDGMRTYVFPNAANYLAGQPVHFIDNTGSLTDTNFVRVTTGSANTFNGATQIDILKPYFDAAFFADPVSKNWTVSIPTASATGGLAITPFSAIPRVSSTATLTCAAASSQEHNSLVLNTASTALSIVGAVNGKTGIIHFIQDNVGSRAVTLPFGSKTPNNGLGILGLSTAGNALDKVSWDYDGTNYTFTVLGVQYTAALPPTFTTSDVDTVTAVSTTGSINQGGNPTNASNFKFGIASKLIANGGVTNGASYTIGKITMNIFKTGSPAWNVKVGIYSDASGVPGALMGSASSAVPTATGVTLTTETATDFDTNASVVGKRNQANITVTNGSSNLTAAPGTFLPATDGGCLITVASGTGAFPANTVIGAIATDGSSASMINGNSRQGVAATAGGVCTLSVQHVYWVVLFGDNTTATTADYVSWAYHNTAGNQFYRSATGAAWSSVSTTFLGKYIAWR